MQKQLQDFNNQQTSQNNQIANYQDQDDQQNLNPQQKSYQNQYQQKPQTQLENIIMEKIHSSLKEEDLISKQLEIKLQKLTENIMFNTAANEEEKLKMRMHQLALSKILVNTHGKTEFYLVKAHHHLGQAYLNYKCYEQALDHLTMALKKNAKINDMNQIKLYHSYVLTTYSRCYFQISSYDDALQILKKAYDMQLGCQSQNQKIDNFQTLRLISNCHLKLKNYSSALEFIQKVLQIVQQRKGKQSKQYAKSKVQKAKILICDDNKQNQAIIELQSAINTLQSIKYQNQIQIAEYYEILSSFYQKVKNFDKEIQCLQKKCQIYSMKYEEGHQKTLKVKKNIASLLQKYNRISQAIRLLQQILQNQEKYYPQNRATIGKTLKTLGLCYLNFQNKIGQAQTLLKKAQKILTQYGIPRSVKQIKIKLQQISQKREGKLSHKQDLKNIESELRQQAIGMAN